MLEVMTDVYVAGLTPQEKVFGTGELLELILLQCSVRALLQVQTVGRSWMQSIQNSSRMQKAPCFQDIAKDKAADADVTSLRTTPNNTSALRMPRAYVEELREDSVLEIDDRFPWDPTVCEYHDYSKLLAQTGPYVGNPFLADIFTMIFYNRVPSYKFRASGAVFQKGGSWKEMFVTQPPVTKIIVLSTTQTIGYLVAQEKDKLSKVYGYGLRLDNDSGLTLGDLYEAVSMINEKCKAIVRKHPWVAKRLAAPYKYPGEEEALKAASRDVDSDADGGDAGEHMFYFDLLQPEQ